MRNSQPPVDWDDTVAIDDEDTTPLGLEPTAPGPVWAVGEAKPVPPERLPWWRWVGGGCRAALWLSPEVGHAQPSPWQVLWLTLLGAALQLGLARLEVTGPAVLDWRAWLVPWWMTLVVLWAAWFALPPRREAEQDPDPWHLHGLGSWFALTTFVTLPAQLALQLLSLSVLREWLAFESPRAQQVYWGLFVLLVLWALSAVLRLTARFAGPRWRLGVLALVMGALTVLSVWQFPDRPWAPDESAALAADTPEPPRLHLSQATFETQQALWPALEQGLLPQREGVTEVYGLVFAPYAEEAVFRRESQMVGDVLRQRFDADGRVLTLINHAETADSLPWATPQNLRRALGLIAQRMDREHDVLVLYLTSHGAQDFKLAASHWPLEVEPIDPQWLRSTLDELGIQNRVLAISACYSGGWITPLASDTSLVMTAADATHTSYGCGHRSELTFFGRALFDEQLRQTHSFTEAFKRMLPVIAEREQQAQKPDGPSNPQISVGARVGPVLSALEQRLGKR
ncbi:C13 family peptidase [Curvibacter sp. HBC61]|uniref:C13 family peptidase n=1 Tax=Curvibacter cyanobacteriorum TaxID=3026422 RepID=A0ABT5N281_9BURK|nr:C13 family peptidase [Curvibacter sp. HBC61]MDD0839631.1 C13 family peptidase [Curvibacter sp. HBC61]